MQVLDLPILLQGGADMLESELGVGGHGRTA
jgi:hypothetical protein